jgi:hypothetical protein
MNITLKKYELDFSMFERVALILTNDKNQTIHGFQCQSFVEDILYQFDYSIQNACNSIITNCNKKNAYYKLALFFLPNCSTYLDNDTRNATDNLKSYFKHINEINKNNHKHFTNTTQRTNKQISSFMILDNCTNKDLIYKSIKYSFKYSIEYNHLFLNVIHNYELLNPTIKKYVDYVFIFNDTNKTTLQNIYLDWCCFLCTYMQFYELIDKYTTRGRCLVIKKAYSIISPYIINTNKNYINILDYMFYYEKSNIN